MRGRKAACFACQGPPWLPGSRKLLCTLAWSTGLSTRSQVPALRSITPSSHCRGEKVPTSDAGRRQAPAAPQVHPGHPAADPGKPWASWQWQNQSRQQVCSRYARCRPHVGDVLIGEIIGVVPACVGCDVAPCGEGPERTVGAHCGQAGSTPIRGGLAPTQALMVPCWCGSVLLSCSSADRHA